MERPVTYLHDPIEAHCNACGADFKDSGELTRCSLDAFAEKGDYDLFCPGCDSEDVTLFEVP